VARAAAGNDSDLAVARRIGPHENPEVVARRLHEIGVRQENPLDKLVDEVLRVVDDFSHSFLSVHFVSASAKEPCDSLFVLGRRFLVLNFTWSRTITPTKMTP